ncbi:MAG: hypothetical protein RLY30_1063 [Pseudomonadota bacterium]|jgi:tRNA-dihydrouridine synthase B
MALSSPLALGPFKISNRVFVAPMAGVTDRPFRLLAKRLGADYAVGEMAASNAALWASHKTMRRLNHEGEPSPRAIQIAGSSPEMMAQATRFNIERGAQVVDINMGCPAKKVCNKAAGSALMQDEPLVRDILSAVVKASEGQVPITLKMRTGFSRSHRNAVLLARMAEDLGIAMVTVHGRTREDQYQGQAEYDTIAEVKSRVHIPVVANGDIDSCEKAQAVLRYTGADAVMVGRAGQGRPWIYGQIHHFLTTGKKQPDPSLEEIVAMLRQHLLDHYAFHGESSGVRSARKHIGWTFKGLGGVRVFREGLEQAETAEEQLAMVDRFAAMLTERRAA